MKTELRRLPRRQRQAVVPALPLFFALLLVVALLLVHSPLPAEQQAQFRISANVVRVDAVVTDGDGNFIDDLRPEEIGLFGDGQRQEIVGIELVDLAAGEVRRIETAGLETAGIEAATGASAPPTPDVIRRDRAAGGEPASDLGAVIFFVDLPGLTFKNSITFAESMERVFGEIEQLALPYAIYLVDMAGRLREIQPLTSNRDGLRDAAGTVRSTPASVSRDNFFWQGALDADGGPMSRVARGSERIRTIYTYRLLHDFVDSLAHRAGRTALVWVSTGVDLAAYETIERPYQYTGEANPTPGARFRNYSPDLGVLDLQEQLHRAANAANVSIYSVDPTTLADFYLTAGGIKRRDGGAEDARGNSLRNAAHATGGDVFIGWTDLNRVLRRIERDAGRFYLISYVPPGAGEGEYHEIRVEVSRSGSDVRARRGYVRYSESDRLARTVRSALDLPGTVSGLDVTVQGLRAREANGQALLVVDTAVRAALPANVGSSLGGPAGTFEPLQTAGLVDGQTLLLFATIRNAAGEPAATVENQRLTPAPGAPPPPAGGRDLAAAYWTHRAAHRLVPGDYDVSVVVLDPRSERVGAAKLEVQILDAAGEWDTSDPWLVAEAPDGSTVPVIGGRVPEGRRAFMYVEVYNGVTPEVGGRVLPASGAEPIAPPGEADTAAQAAPRGPSVPLTEEAGVHHASIPLTLLPAGHYLLDFYINDPGAGRSRTVRLPLQVVSSQRP